MRWVLNSQKVFIRRKNRGAALVEFIIAGSVVLIALTIVPILGEVGISRLKTISAAKLLAWNRTVFVPKEAFESSGDISGRGADLNGVRGAMLKNNREAQYDLMRHVFRDRSLPGVAIHDNRYAEFTGNQPPLHRGLTVSAVTTNVSLPAPLKGVDTIFDGLRRVQDVMGSSDWTLALSRFELVTGGYIKNEVQTTHAIPPFLLNTVPGLKSLLPASGLGIKEQVTMLVEPWNAGGTNREEQKIQALVPAKLLDIPPYQQIRANFHTAAYQINQINPNYNINNLLLGFRPGDTFEKPPVDRHQLREDVDNFDNRDPRGHFRYYRSFHLNGWVTEPVNHLP